MYDFITDLFNLDKKMIKNIIFLLSLNVSLALSAMESLT